MLYQRWIETARKHANEPAIFSGGRATTFAELSARVAAIPIADQPVIARTGSVDFFARILAAWRDGVAVIPVEAQAPDPALHAIPSAEVRLVKHTPGASGVPRGIFFNAEQVLADVDRLAEAMELKPGVPNLGVISLAHSYGFSNVALPLLFHGVAVDWLESPFPRIVEEAFRRHERLVVAAVPSMWRAWHRSGILKGAPVRLALSAGAPLALALEREVFESCGLKIRNFYGASECGGISMDGKERPRDEAEDVGTPLPGVRVSLGQGNRFLIASNGVAMGYDWAREDDCLGEGTYLTRDLGAFGEDGSLRHLGTAGGAINVAGRKISPAKVEAAIAATGMVKRVKVFAVPSADPERCQEIAVILERNEASLDQVKTATAGRLQLWELPRHWSDDPELWRLGAAALRQAFHRR